MVQRGTDVTFFKELIDSGIFWIGTEKWFIFLATEIGI
jgi:hypothetical protein